MFNKDDVVVLVYPGLSKKEKEIRRKAFEPKTPYDDGFTYPAPTGKEFYYYDKKLDGERTKAIKANRRKEYREMRLKELEEKIKERDLCRKICGVTFHKGVPKEVDLEELENGAPEKLILGYDKKGRGSLVHKKVVYTLEDWEAAGKPGAPKEEKPAPKSPPPAIKVEKAKKG